MDRDRPLHYLYEGDCLSLEISREYPVLRQKMLEKGLLAGGSDSKLVIRFVGVAVLDDLTFVMLPKVRLSADNQAIQRQVLRSLRTYAQWKPSHHEPSPYLNADPLLGDVSGIAVFEWLMNDFLEYGLYRRTEIDDVLDGMGDINWAVTIGATSPIFSDGRPLYVDAIRRRTANDGSNFATMLHLHLLEILSDKYSAILDHEPIVLDHEAVDRFDLLPDLAQCKAKLADEMRQVFSDRSSHLLSMMITALEAIQIETSAGLSLYGTSTFHNVWEAACARLCGNEVDRWTPSLPAPQWLSVDGVRSMADTLRPDAVTPINEATLLIADAKYYRPRLSPNLGGVPGVNDVAKQVWYKQYLTEPAKRRGYKKIENVFLFPGSNDAVGSPLLQRIGSVEFPVGIERVDAVKVDFMQALRAYSNRSDQSRRAFLSDLVALLSESAAAPNSDPSF